MLYRIACMAFFLTATLFAAPIRAEGNATFLAEKLKTSINQMVEDVQEAESSEAKRKILSDYLSKMETGLKEIKALPSLDEQDKKSLAELEDKFQKYLSVLEGSGDAEGVADNDLDDFAGFVQQDMEQAGVSAGGVYLSTGALLVLILILIVLF